MNELLNLYVAKGVFSRRERKMKGEGHVSPKWRKIERI